MSRSRASGSGSSSGQPHEHDADLVGRGPPASQGDRHRDRKPGRARFTGGGQGRHVPGTDGREQRIVHGRPEWAHARLECRKVGVHEGDPVPRAALTEQHRGADPAADERRQHALKAEADPSEEVRAHRVGARRSPEPSGGDVGLGTAGRCGGGAAAASGSTRSKSRCAIATADIPSAIAWWMRSTRPTRPALAPGTTRSSHGGRSSDSGRFISCPARALEPGEPGDRVDEPDVLLDVGRHLDPAVPATVRDGHAPQRRELGDPRPERRAQGGQVGAAVGPDEAAGREQAGDEEHVDLADMVEHEVRFVDRREPPCRRPHATSLGAAEPRAADRRLFRGPKDPPIFRPGIGRILDRMPRRQVRSPHVQQRRGMGSPLRLRPRCTPV